MLREVTDRVFRTGEQLETALQIPCIALVPLSKAEQERKTPRQKMLRPWAPDKKNLIKEANIFKTVADSPLSPFTEAIRAIKLAVDLHPGSRKGRVIGFTSALPNEGKSTISASLASLITQVGGRVLLVDCDLRNPALSRQISPGASVGIVDVIAGRVSKRDAIFKNSETGISLLPAVKKTPIFHTSEVLASETMRKLFDDLRGEYDYIVVDLPPLAPIIDVRATTHLIDSYILIVEWGCTRIDVVEQALRGSPGIYESLIGAALNKTDMARMKRYDGSRETLYHNANFARYGYSE
jgi:capsular exopolysaccharide synthesis family protein